MSSDEVKIYKVTADYRKNNPNKPHYYVVARNQKEARDRFKNRISWLDIHDVEVCEDSIAKVIIAAPMKHILI